MSTIPSATYYEMCDHFGAQIDRLTRENEALRSLLSEVQDHDFAHHPRDCEFTDSRVASMDARCTCGVTDLELRIDAALRGKEPTK